MTREVSSAEELLDLAGADLGETDWVTVTQDQVNLFADATGDHQWIHVDPERAAAESPFGGPIAHGYLTLSLVNLFLPQLLDVQGASMGVNVGLGKVRFTSPVPVGSQIRGQGKVLTVEEAKAGVQIIVAVSIQVDGSDKPACIAETISRFFF